MRLSDYLSQECVVLLTGQTKAEALEEMVTVMADSEMGASVEELQKAVLAREEMMSTGIGNGLAIPHVRLESVKQACVAVGVTAAGINDYESLDNQPVHIVVLIAAPAGKHEVYIRLLAKVVDVLKQPELRQEILQASESETVYKILLGAEE